VIALVLVSFLVAAMTVFGLVRLARRHAGRYAADLPQRFHHGDVPRVGGLGILAGLGVGWLAAAFWPHGLNVRWPLGAAFAFFACLLPAVLGAAAEDMTQRVPVRWRLALTLWSAALLCWALDLRIDRLDVPPMDSLFAAVPLLPVVFAAFAIGGLPHAFNLIDGYNGLASAVAIIISLAIAHVALQMGDRQLAATVICLAGATAGFFIWNYPRGKIFAGDSGAYVWGLVIAVACVALVQRHRAISPWFPILLLVYPVWETLFSTYRKLARGQSPGAADALHFHQLIFRRIVRSALVDEEDRALLSRNNRTSPYLWLFCVAAVVPAVLFRSSTPILMGMTALFVVTYVAAYLMIVRFKVPRWLRS
jgi:UDP-N-acetylmuramyl pentapeptide phosphotransferase/UDP-N-acetylglucosamine-1-phosphate transferase